MFEATTRRGFLETLTFGAGVAAGVGLVGLLNGCELGQQKPTWEEAKASYSTVTDFARFLGLSISHSLKFAM